MDARSNIPDVDRARAYIGRFNFFSRYANGPAEGDAYVAMHARRFVETLRRLPPLARGARVLELGAVPYSMTLLLRRYLQVDVATLSLYEIESPHRTHVLESSDGSERHEFEYRAVNVERDVFPFADGTFDVVLCCEILEHLLINPSHMCFEAHRVLRPGGHFVMTTPNAVRQEKLDAMLAGRAIGDAYHGNGIYGRHNREFAPPEVPQLLESCGYSIVSHETLDVYDTSPPGAPPGREDTIITVAAATGRRRIGTPPGMYVLMDEYLNVVRPAITMGTDEVGQIGRGWYDAEDDGQLAYRWMQRQSVVHLYASRATTIGLHLQVHHPDLVERPVVIGLRVAGERVEHVVRDHRWQDVEFALRSEADGPIRIEIDVDRDWVPGAAAGTGDMRSLGIRVHRCWSR